MATMLAPEVGEYLGGPDIVGAITSDFDLVRVVEAGLPVAAIDDMIAHGRLTAQEVDALVLPRRTLSHRRAHAERLTPEESDRLSRVAWLLAYAAQVFGDGPAGGQWLRHPQYGLRGAIPLTLAATTAGARLVEDELTRIASGDLA